MKHSRMIIDKIIVVVSVILLNGCIALGYIASAGSAIKTEMKFIELEKKITSIEVNGEDIWSK